MTRVERVLAAVSEGQAEVEQLYRDLHQHPELSMREHRTVAELSRRLAGWGYQVHPVGGGLVGILDNGPGGCVLFRADMDGLPVTEDTGLPYASTATDLDADGREVGVMHACGHDVHMACAMGAAKALAESRDAWSGTYLALFQPGEEVKLGAQSMVDAGLAQVIPKPDVVLGQHVLPACVAGHVASAPGPVMAANTSVRVVVRGIGTPAAMPHLGVDPIVLACSIVVRLQSIVAREIPPTQFGLITVGAIHAGSKSTTIPDQAELLISLRAYHSRIRDTLVKAIERVVRGECAAAGTPLEPSFEYYDSCPATDNHARIESVVRRAFVAHFSPARVEHLAPAPASEDFSVIPDSLGVPYTYWALGSYLPGHPQVPNHDPTFAPPIRPTLRTGTEAALVASLAFLAEPDPDPS